MDEKMEKVSVTIDPTPATYVYHNTLKISRNDANYGG